MKKTFKAVVLLLAVLMAFSSCAKEEKQTDKDTVTDAAAQTESASEESTEKADENTSSIDDAKLDEILNAENLFKAHNSVSFDAEYISADTNGKVYVRAVKNEDGTFSDSYITDYENIGISYATEIKDGNGCFAYSTSTGDGYTYSSITVDFSDGEIGAEFGMVYYIYVYAGNEKIVSGSEADGIATVTAKFEISEDSYMLDTYTIDVAKGQIISTDRMQYEADGSVSLELKTANYVYDSADITVDMTAKNNITGAEDLCKLTYIVNPGKDNTKTYTVSVEKGTYTGYINGSDADVLFYSDEQCQNSVDVSTDADEATYYVVIE